MDRQVKQNQNTIVFRCKAELHRRTEPKKWLMSSLSCKSREA